MSVSEQNRDSLVALDARVGNLELGLSTLSRNVETRLTNLQTDFDANFKLLHERLEKRDDRRWLWVPAVSIIGIILAVVGGLGTLTIQPMKEGSAQVKQEVRDNRADFIDRDRRLWERIHETRSQLDFLRGQLTPLPLLGPRQP